MKIAVVGSGISGLGAALLFQQGHEVHLFEAAKQLGGHAHTVHVDGQPLDTGFLVYNELTYPNLTGLFAHLHVPTVASDMSLCVCLREQDFEWSGTSLNTIFAQRRNLFRPGFHAMLRDILRFHREAEMCLDLSRRHHWTLGELLKERNYGERFRRHYLLPMASAIWSTPEKQILDFPAATLMTFLLNHKLVQVNQRPVWRTVKGGSIEYVRRIASHLKHVHLNTPVLSVERRSHRGPRVFTPGAETDFDAVIFASHAPITARLLASPSAIEREILGSMQTIANRGILHQDVKLMPRRKRAWSAWNVFASHESDQRASLTYHLNRLQPVTRTEDYFLTLNPVRAIDSVLGEFHYAHPRFDQRALAAQQRLNEIQGQGGVFYAGAWTRYGFHEDGLLSAVRLAQSHGLPIPWAGSEGELAPRPMGVA